MNDSHEHFERMDDALSNEAGLMYAAATVARGEGERVGDVKLPAALRGKLVRDADRFFDRSDVAGRIGLSSGKAFVFGALSAAACLAIVALPFFSSVSKPVMPPGQQLLILPVPPTPSSLNPTAVGPFSGVASGYESVRGEVVWDAEAQRGRMRFEGLPPNDPKAGQYQLWIVDPTRGSYPVDGGVFDVSPDEQGVAVVPFEPRLPIENATLFAVTYEQPGGVVVSDGPLLVTATPEAS